MTKKFVDCFMLINTAMSLRGGNKLPEMGRPILRDVITTTVNISLSLHDLKIANNDNDNLEVEMSALLNQNWVDPRLGANGKTRKMAIAGHIWKPKIVNVNGENSVCNNEDTMFWRGFGDEGKVLLSEKIRIRSACTANYRRFPFDFQMCEFKFGTFRFPRDEVRILWDPVPLHVTTELNFNEFNITNILTYIETDVRCSGNFSTAVVQFALRRHPQHYIRCIILPSFLLSLLNYASFWFTLNKRSTRIFMNALIFGFMFFLNYISVCLTHPTPHLKAIDLFTLISTLFSLFVLFESIFVDVMCTLEETQFHLKKVASSKEYPRSVLWIEYAMKLSYPVFYIFFVIVYGWLYF